MAGRLSLSEVVAFVGGGLVWLLVVSELVSSRTTRIETVT